MRRFDAKRANRSPIHPLIPRQKFRDGILRDVFLEINIYIHARPCVRVRARTRYYRATIIILPFHAFWLGRHHGRRRIAIFEFPS